MRCRESSPTLWLGVQSGTTTRENTLGTVSEDKHLLDPSIVLPGIDLAKTRTYMHQKAHTRKFLTALLFVILQHRNQPKRPSTMTDGVVTQWDSTRR